MKSKLLKKTYIVFNSDIKETEFELIIGQNLKNFKSKTRI